MSIKAVINVNGVNLLKLTQFLPEVNENDLFDIHTSMYACSDRGLSSKTTDNVL